MVSYNPNRYVEAGIDPELLRRTEPDVLAAWDAARPKPEEPKPERRLDTAVTGGQLQRAIADAVAAEQERSDAQCTKLAEITSSAIDAIEGALQRVDSALGRAEEKLATQAVGLADLKVAIAEIKVELASERAARKGLVQDMPMLNLRGGRTSELN